VARTREFNREDALLAAMETFWEKGYDAASLHDLTDRMGISRSSLYETFGDKQTLFLEALDCYGQTCGESVVDRLTDGASVRDALQQFFDATIESATSGKGKGGCFNVNAATSAPNLCPEAKAKLRDGLRCMEARFLRVIVHGQSTGEIDPTRDPCALARFLVGLDYGLNAVARIQPDREFLADMVAAGLSSIS
jgi:TetR/AcrR family transcriptional repressor of nem operon